MNGPREVEQALERLWKNTPVGSGKDLNTVVKYIEQLQGQLVKGEE